MAYYTPLSGLKKNPAKQGLKRIRFKD